MIWSLLKFMMFLLSILRCQTAIPILKGDSAIYHVCLENKALNKKKTQFKVVFLLKENDTVGISLFST